MSKFREKLASIKTAGVADTYGDDYKNQWGKVTPYHIMFKDFASDIAGLPKNEAIEFASNKLDELQAQYAGDEGYSNLSNEAVNKFKMVIQKAKDGMGVLFKIKDFLLAGEGLSVGATIEDALRNPVTASKVAGVFNKLLEARQTVLDKRK